MSDRPLRVHGVTLFDLFATRCKECGETSVHGFWDQLEKDVDVPRRRVTVTFTCQGCEKSVRKRYCLTTGRGRRHRLVDWARVAWAVLDWTPRRWRGRAWQPVSRAFLWLERNLPI